MGGTLGSLYCRRNLRVRCSEKTGDLLGQRLVGGKTGQLALPQVEVAPGHSVEIARGSARRFVGFGGHAVHYKPSTRERAFADAKVALSHCGIGANLTMLE